MTRQISFQTYTSAPAVNYEQYFVPAIGAPLADDLVELAAFRPGERVANRLQEWESCSKQASQTPGSAGST